jgi:hypothetical protein
MKHLMCDCCGKGFFVGNVASRCRERMTSLWVAWNGDCIRSSASLNEQERVHAIWRLFLLNLINDLTRVSETEPGCYDLHPFDGLKVGIQFTLTTFQFNCSWRAEFASGTEAERYAIP